MPRVSLCRAAGSTLRGTVVVCDASHCTSLQRRPRQSLCGKVLQYGLVQIRRGNGLLEPCLFVWALLELAYLVRLHACLLPTLAIRPLSKIPSWRMKDATGVPRSACFSTATICPTEKRFRFLANPLSQGYGLPKDEHSVRSDSWPKLPGPFPSLDWHEDPAKLTAMGIDTLHRRSCTIIVAKTPVATRI
jgi:hypothetical protein